MYQKQQQQTNENEFDFASIQGDSNKCSEHQNEFSYFCETCDCNICSTCAVAAHIGHKTAKLRVTSVPKSESGPTSAMEKMRTSLRRTSLALTSGKSFFNNINTSVGSRRLSFSGFGAEAMNSNEGNSMAADEKETVAPAEPTQKAEDILRSIGLADLAAKYTRKQPVQGNAAKKDRANVTKKDEKSLKTPLKEHFSQEAMDKVLALLPSMERADNLISLRATQPHIAMIADRAMNLKAGAELYTVMLGPRQKEWRPFGTNINECMDLIAPDTPDVKSASAEAKPGCPVFVQTSAGIKFKVNIPSIKLSAYIPGLFNFINYHFDNCPELKVFLEKFLNLSFLVEQLSATKSIISIIEKYLLNDTLSLQLNINGMIEVIEKEIIITVKTPAPETANRHADRSSMIMGKPGKPTKRSSVVFRPTDLVENESSTLTFHYELNFLDLLEDISRIENYTKDIFEATSEDA